jgi:hypothetical protein
LAEFVMMPTIVPGDSLASGVGSTSARATGNKNPLAKMDIANPFKYLEIFIDPIPL